jgi:ketosteroid isomerase-like protein
MTTTTANLAPAETLLDALAARDFDAVADAFEPDATLAALLPRGHDDWEGATAIRGAFERWFGDVESLEVADASIGRIGDLLQLRWRLRVQGGPRFGAGPMVVEQHASAHRGSTGRIGRMSLLCTGFWPQTSVTDEKEHG